MSYMDLIMSVFSNKHSINVLWLLLEKILRVVLVFFVGVWIARYLGPEDYGLLVFAIAFVSLFGAVSNLGLNGIVVRELVKFPEKKGQILGTTFLLKLCGNITLFVMAGCILQYLDLSDIEQKMILIIALAQIFSSFDTLDFYFQAKTKLKYSSLSSIFRNIFSSIFKIFLIVSQQGLVWFAIAVFFESMVGFLCLLFFYLRKYKIKWTATWETAQQLLKDSWPIIVSGFAVLLYMRSDQVMIRLLLDEKSLGIYSVVVSLSDAWVFIAIAVTQALYPALVKIRDESRVFYNESFQVMYNFLVLCSIAVSFILFVFSGSLVNFLFGPEYKGAGDVLSIYVWGIVFIFLNNGAWCWYRCENYQGYAAIIALAGAAINIALNFVLIPAYGIKGAAISTVLAYSLVGCFGNLLFKETLTVFKMQLKALVNFWNPRFYLNYARKVHLLR